MARGHKTGGRQKGSRNKRTAGIEALAQGILEDPAYQRKLKERALAGALPPALEVLLYHYLWGKPAEATRDDQHFLEDLLSVVLKYADAPQARQEIRAVLEAYDARPAGLRVVA